MAPHFKKLTDCPENLREAIDWLIQVRHGNGGDQGLTKLSQALKKLIGEAIRKARNSINDRKEQLECPPKYWKSGSYCETKEQSIKSTRQEIENLQSKIQPNKESLNVLESKLSKLESEKEKHYNEDHYLSDDARKNALKNITDRQSHLGALTNSLEVFIAERNYDDAGNCKTVIERLCDGLETLLGFNSHTKGYTGEGIVYSDLDRLCDAVMAFLHGVLESVKDDESVRTYDNHISGVQLNKVLETLTSSVGMGTGEFSKQVCNVSGWLARYDDEVKRKAEAVKKQLSSLDDKITKNMDAIRNANKDVDVDVDEHSRKLTAWIHKLNNNFHSLLTVADRAVNALDPELRKRIQIHYDKIKIYVENFSKSALLDEADLGELLGNLENAMEKLGDIVNEDVSKQVENLKTYLKKEFETIQEQIKAVQQALKEVQSNLHDWIGKAKEVIAAAIKQSGEILKTLNGEQDGEKYGERKKVTEAADKLQNDATALWKVVEKAKEGLSGLSRSIINAFEALETVHKETLKALRQAVDGQVQQAQRILGGLDAQVRQDLESGVKNHIKIHIGKAITAFEAGLKSAGQAHDSAVDIVQEFQIGLGNNRGDAPTLAAWSEQARRVGSDLFNAIESLSDFKNFKAIINALVNFKYNTNKNFFQCLTEDLEFNLDKAIGAIKSNLRTHVSRYHSHATSGGAIHNAIEKVQTYLDEYFTENSGEIKDEKLREHAYEEDGVNKKQLLTAEIQKIHDTGYQVLDGAKIHNGIDKIDAKTFIKQFGVFQQSLATFADKVKDLLEKKGAKQGTTTDKGVHTLLIEFDTILSGEVASLGYELNKNLDDIKLQIDGIIGWAGQNKPNTVEKILKDAHMFLTETVKRKSQECIQEIQIHFITQLDQTTENIQKNAIKRFMKTKSVKLNELKRSVKQMIDEIYKNIEYDKNNGVKGFLWKLKHEFMKEIDPLKPHSSVKISDAANYLKKGFEELFEMLDEQEECQAYKERVSDVVSSVDSLLSQLKNSQHFDNLFSSRLADFKNAIADYHTETFKDAAKNVLAPLKLGLKALASEFQKAYISRYSIQKWEDNEIFSQNCAKIFLSIIHILYTDLNHLRERCEQHWNKLRIYSSSKNNLGQFFDKCGYRVSIKDGQQSGELQCKIAMTGGRILGLFTSNGQKGNPQIAYDISASLIDLSTKISGYYTICNLNHIDSPVYPCSIRDMLSWLCGLWYTMPFRELNTLFQKQQSLESDTKLKNIYGKLFSQVMSTSVATYNTITTICGHGRGAENADYPYACNFVDNSRGFHYPSNGSALLVMMTDICKRLLYQLCFLCRQCQYTVADGNGWADCQYGRNIQGYQWTCGNSSHVANDCLPKSPLQAHLMDGLPGFMPHKVTSVGCKSECSTCPKNVTGEQCITPMGFCDIYVSASKTGTGRDIYNVLYMFCGKADSPLCALLYSLMCIMPYPPIHLADMFMFYSQMFIQYNRIFLENSELEIHIKGKVIPNCFPLWISLHNYFDASMITSSLKALFHSAEDHKTTKSDNSHCDLSSISTQRSGIPSPLCPESSTCAPYLYALCSNTHHTYPLKHAKLYLSWFVHSAWTFRDMLEGLFKSFCNIDCVASGCASCQCKTGHHGIVDPGSLKPNCHCPSIVQCKGTLNVLYRYGFTFGEAGTLKRSDIRKTCVDFCRQISKVLNSKHFTNLFTVVDDFLFAIRVPFFWTTVALWLLSVFYLLHIMVIRLDLLHIKSHLHSPSSHRIAAQSLLAAARVGKLSKISYLQA